MEDLGRRDTRPGVDTYHPSISRLSRSTGDVRLGRLSETVVVEARGETADASVGRSSRSVGRRGRSVGRSVVGPMGPQIYDLYV